MQPDTLVAPLTNAGTGIAWSSVAVLAAVVASVGLTLFVIFRRLIPGGDGARQALTDFPTTNFRSISGTASFLLFWAVVLSLEAVGVRLRESMVDGIMWGIIAFSGVSALEKVGKWRAFTDQTRPESVTTVQNVTTTGSTSVSGTTTTEKPAGDATVIDPRTSDPSRVDDPAEVITLPARGEAG